VKILELFAGTRSIGKEFEKAGHDVLSIDYDTKLEGIDWYRDISTITAKEIFERFGQPAVIWASPDCTTYSVASLSTHRQITPTTRLPKTEYAKKCDMLNIHMINMIMELSPKYWFIENPRGALRKMDFMQGLPRYTVTYCQYGDTRMKPSDIWTNHPDPKFKPMCKNGDPCHVSAPRGSKTGTQGLAKRDRSIIPQELCRHIVEICEPV